MARNNLGAELMAAGRVGEAAAQIQESLALQPDNASAQTNLGNALIKLGRPAEALEHYARALEVGRAKRTFSEPRLPNRIYESTL